MGTRHLTIVVHDGKVKLAQYGQWDGYPSGAGDDIVHFLLTKFDKHEFLNNLANAKRLSEKQEDAIWQTEFGVDIKANGGLVDWKLAKAFAEKHPQLSRDSGSKILNYIQSTTKPVLGRMSRDLSFASDSLFCEWAYVLDLDNMALEVYRGFNKTRLGKGERFEKLQKKKITRGHDGTKYYPVKHQHIFAFADLTEKCVGEYFDRKAREEEAKERTSA